MTTAQCHGGGNSLMAAGSLEQEWECRPFLSHSHHCCLGTLPKIKIRSCHTPKENPGWFLFVCVTTGKRLGKTLHHYLAPALNLPPSPRADLCFGHNKCLASPWQLTPLLLTAPLTRPPSLLLTRLTPVISSRKPSSFSQQATCSSTARNNTLSWPHSHPLLVLIIRGPTRLGANRRVVSLSPTTSVSKLSLKKDHPKQGFRNTLNRGFPDSSAGKESACNAGDPGSIPGLGRSPGEGIGYSLSIPGLSDRLLWYHSACVQTTFTSNKASLVPQTVENPPVVQ